MYSQPNLPMNPSSLTQPTRRKASPRLQIDTGSPFLGQSTLAQSSTSGIGTWPRAGLPGEDTPLNLGAETPWDGMRHVGVAQGRQRSNTVVGAVFAPTSASSLVASDLGLGLELGPVVGDAEEPLQPPVHVDGASSAYGYGFPMGAEFDDELTRRLLREKRHLKEEGRWVDDGDIESIVLRRKVSEDSEIGSNLLCNVCFRQPGDMCFSRCRHIFCSFDLEEHVRRTLQPDTYELACPACGTSCTYGRDVISVSTGRPTSLPMDRRTCTSDAVAPIPKTTHRPITKRTDPKQSKTPQLPSPPITPAPSLPISLYDQRSSSLYADKGARPLDERIGVVAMIERAVGEQFSRVLSLVALALVLWVLVK
ncbi:hypothetical protein FRC08_006577 [Ceratobasidium sp. 394]|nr:hypothetical protein FRC08_006577 [Ceratobasidium sp. 394]